MKLFLILMVTAVLGGCNQQTVISSDFKNAKDKSKTSKKDEKADDVVVSEPVMVGGAFLVCALDGETTTVNQIGCRIEDINGEKSLLTNSTSDLVVSRISDGAVVTMEASQESTFWHWTGILLDGAIENYAAEYVGTEAGVFSVSTSIQTQHPKQIDRETPKPINVAFHTIFITSFGFTPGLEFNGLDGADQRCNELASVANLQGFFKAVLSGSDINASDRIDISKPVYNVVGDLLANPSNFWSKSHLNPILADEYGDIVAPAEAQVWTGSNDEGRSKNDEQCDNWTNPDADRGNFGSAVKLERWLDEGGSADCNDELKLYCISQPTVVISTQ